MQYIFLHLRLRVNVLFINSPFSGVYCRLPQLVDSKNWFCARVLSFHSFCAFLSREIAEWKDSGSVPVRRGGRKGWV